MTYEIAIAAYETELEQEVQDQAIMMKMIKLHGASVLTRENETAHITSSAIILNAKMDKMLMVHHNIYKTWAWTGGHADGDGNLLAVALREAREETGVVDLQPLSESIFSVDIVPVFGHIKRGKYVSSHLHMNITYVLIGEEEAILTVKPDENSGVKWVPLTELSEHANEPYLVMIYEKIIRKARSYAQGKGMGK